MRRYLLHVLPKGFTRVRHYGFLAGFCRTQSLEKIRAALAVAEAHVEETDTDSDAESYRCPLCKIGTLRRIGELHPHRVVPEVMRRR